MWLQVRKWPPSMFSCSRIMKGILGPRNVIICCLAAFFLSTQQLEFQTEPAVQNHTYLLMHLPSDRPALPVVHYYMVYCLGRGMNQIPTKKRKVSSTKHSIAHVINVLSFQKLANWLHIWNYLHISLRQFFIFCRENNY